MTRRLLALAGCLALATSTPAFAQLAPPNDLGVALGHIHLVVKSVDAQKEFWTTMLGGTMVSNGPLTLIQFPGIFIMLRQGEATGPPAGSIVNHFGLVYGSRRCARTMEGSRGQVRRRRDEPESGIRLPTRRFDSRGGLWRSVATWASQHGSHSSLSAAVRHPCDSGVVCEVFGGIPGKRQRVALPGLTDCDYFHRFNLSFSAGEGKLAPTKTRELDHLGFDVRNIDEFEKKLVAQGLKFEAPPRQVPNTQTRVAFLTDPWGTYIEVTDTLRPDPVVSSPTRG